MIPKPGNQDNNIATLAKELMNGATSFHELHLMESGPGSYAAHKALEELYEALPNHADSIVEQYQGAVERIIRYPKLTPIELTNIGAGINHIRTLKVMVEKLQTELPYSELVNQLDELKSTLDSAKYKLLFLK